MQSSDGDMNAWRDRALHFENQLNGIALGLARAVRL